MSIIKKPTNWNLTLDDLFREIETGKRKIIEPLELEWAKEYEFSQIPKDSHFPQKGDLYKAKINQTISYITAWSAPFSGGGEATLYEGECIWIDTAPTEKAIGLYALPVEYKKLEERIIPQEERKNPHFGGFHLYIKIIKLNNDFTLIQTGFNGKC